MKKNSLKYIFPLLLITILLIEWINVFFIGGVIGVVSWWCIFLGSFIGLIIFTFLIIKVTINLIKHKKIQGVIFITMCISIIMGLPICWFFGIGQIAYPAKIASIEPAVSIRLPINETTVVGWGGNSLETNRPHAIAPMERWGYDLLVEPYSLKSDRLDDYGIYDVEVVAPASGKVIAVYDQEGDILPGSEDNKTMVGNFIYMQLEETGTYLIMAHLKKGSILVQEGQDIKEGTPIARVGNSGATSEPHLHIHHQRQNPATTNMFLSEGLPLYFRDIDGPAMPNGGANRAIISPSRKKDANKSDSIDNIDYQEFIAENEGFRVTTYINKLEFNENEEIKMYSTLEYIGEEDTIDIWSGEPYFYFTIFDGEDYFNEEITYDILMRTILKKGEIYTFPFSKSKGYSAKDPKVDFWKQYTSEKELKLPKGEYIFTAYAAFSLYEELAENISIKNEFIVKVK